jgi:flavin reductase (DIM6/NTAB) family NADH-FMN oxidoreductase RutF
MNEKGNGIGKDEFRAALSRFASGVTVITSRDNEGRDHGITVSAFSSVSLEPPMILVCIEKTTGSHDVLAETSHFAVNVLAAEHDALSNRFASRIPDKFDGVACRISAHGVKILEESLVVLECRRVHAFDAGDHTIFVGLVEDSEVKDGTPLVYWHGKYRKLAD